MSSFIPNPINDLIRVYSEQSYTDLDFHLIVGMKCIDGPVSICVDVSDEEMYRYKYYKRLPWRRRALMEGIVKQLQEQIAKEDLAR